MFSDEFKEYKIENLLKRHKKYQPLEEAQLQRIHIQRYHLYQERIFEERMDDNKSGNRKD